MFRNLSKLTNIVRPIHYEQNRRFLTIVNQGFEAYRTAFGRNPGYIVAFI